MNKHHQNFLAWEIITIWPIDRWLRDCYESPIGTAAVCGGGSRGSPLLQASDNTPAVFLVVLLVVSAFGVSFLH